MSHAAELWTLAAEIHQCCEARGYDLALTEAQAQDLQVLHERLAPLETTAAMHARIQACLLDYQASLLQTGEARGWTPPLAEDWRKYCASWEVFTQRHRATTAAVDLWGRCLARQLRAILAAAEKGEV